MPVPELGEARKGKDIGPEYRPKTTYWWAACGCGYTRWVQRTHNYANRKKRLCAGCLKQVSQNFRIPPREFYGKVT